MRIGTANDKTRRAAQRPFENHVSWGPWLFGLTIVAVLVFFWWLLIYSHGLSQTV